MKRDRQLMWEILSRCRDGQPAEKIPGYADESIQYHKGLLIEAGLATGSIAKDHTHSTELPISVVLTGVTLAGHEFLDPSEGPARRGERGPAALVAVWDHQDFQEYFRNLMQEYQEKNGREAQQLLRRGRGEMARSPGNGPLIARIAAEYARKGLYEPALEAIDIFERACRALRMAPTEGDLGRLREYVELQISTSQPHVIREINALYQRHANMSGPTRHVEQAAANGLADARLQLERRKLELRHVPVRIEGAGDDDEPIAFTIMQIGDAHLDSVYQAAIRPAIEDCGLTAKRVDKHTKGGLLKSEIMEFIRTARIVVADVTNARPNCYLEIGFCMGTGKFSNLILTARQDHLSTHPAYAPDGPRVHFDLQGYDMLFWDPANLPAFREDLSARIRRRLSIAERPALIAATKEEVGE